MKRCPKCGDRKAADRFGKNRASSDGLQTWCKKCLEPLKKKWNQENRERKRELGRRWHKENREHSLEMRRLRYAVKKDVILERRRKWYEKHREKMPALNRRRNLRKYGLTEGDYARLLLAQRGRCAICGCDRGRKRFAVDHCHKEKAVRGLLCDVCNIGLGCFRDSPARLRAAATYLERSIDRSAEE